MQLRIPFLLAGSAVVLGAGVGVALVATGNSVPRPAAVRPAALPPLVQVPLSVQPGEPVHITVSRGELISVKLHYSSPFSGPVPTAAPTPAPPQTPADFPLPPSPSASASATPGAATSKPSASAGPVLEQESSARSIDGRMLPAGWRSTTPLAPGALYTATLTVADSDGNRSVQSHPVHVAAVSKTLTAKVSPLAGEVVGVGMPIVVTFNVPIVDRAAVQSRLKVTTSREVEGAWRWFSDSEVHYRPRTYWPARTAIDVHLDLAGLTNGDVIAATGRKIPFRTGAAVISHVDLARYTMTVRSDGQVLRTMPISGGSPRWPSLGGTHIVLSKDRTRIMDSSTVGITGKDAYRTKVDWAVRYTNSGTFVHSAPWSVAAQGRRHVSHGCINASPANAQFFFELSRRGDVVEVTGAVVGPRRYDAGSRTWNYTWQEWIEGSALPVPLTETSPSPAAAPSEVDNGQSSAPAASATPSPSSSD